MYRCYAVRICWFVVYKAKFSVALRFVSLAHLQSIYRWYLVCARLMVIVTSNCSRCIHHSVSVCMGQSVSLAQTNDNEILPHDTMSLIIPISLFSPTHSLTVCVCVWLTRHAPNMNAFISPNIHINYNPVSILNITEGIWPGHRDQCISIQHQCIQTVGN